MVRHIEFEHKQREQELNHFKDEIRAKQEMERKRDDRVRRYGEIAEQAMHS